MDSRALALCLVTLSSCGPTTQPAQPAPAPPPLSLADVGLDEDAMSVDADPCVDFRRFACGGNASATPPLSTEPGALEALVERELLGILDGLAGRADLDRSGARVRDFYAACRDQAKAADKGLEPIRDRLARIAAMRNRRDLAAVLGELHDIAVWPFFTLSAAPGDVAPIEVVALLSGEATAAASEETIARALVLAGYSDDDARAAALEVLGVKERLRAATQRIVTTEARALKRVDRAGLGGLAPRFDWASYFKARGAGDLGAVAVRSIELVEIVGKETSQTPLSSHRHYLTWALISALAPVLGGEISQLISGEAAQDRARMCLAQTAAGVGDDLSRLFVAQLGLPEASRAVAGELINAELFALLANLERSSRVDAATRTRASTVAATMVRQVGHRLAASSAAFAVSPEAFVANVIAARRAEERRALAGVGAAFDPATSGQRPFEARVGYSELDNRLVVPTAVLRPPIFSARRSDTVNLGGLASMVGAPIAAALAPGLEPRCPTTVSVGEVEAIRAAFRVSEQRKTGRRVLFRGRPPGPTPADSKVPADATTPDAAGATEARVDLDEAQSFFVAVAQARCAGERDIGALNRTLAEVPELSSAFECKPGQAMNPPTRCAAW